ncbi:MAG: D-alanine--D-alanine ligase [Vicingaceae bacterium]
MKKILAIAAGGYSAEWEISLKSAEIVLSNVDKEMFEAYILVIRKEMWYIIDGDEHIPLNLNDFSFKKMGKTISIDLVFNAIHGDPGENGKLQGFFESRGIMHTSCNQSLSALTFNKWQCNTILKELGFTCAKSLLFYRGEVIDPDHIVKILGLPVFIKPNQAGSSFGVSKVSTKEQFEQAVKKAFEHDDEILIETFMDGIEVGCGVYRYKGEVIALSPTEIRSQNEFFDYEAKYQGKALEITPAEISDELIELIKTISSSVYSKLHARGIIRVDFIIVDQIPHIVEVNTIPGLSAESIVPKQVRCDGMNLQEFFTRLLEEASY